MGASEAAADTGDTGGGTGLLGGLGTFHIWSVLILGPIVVIFLICLAVLIWNHQRGWTSVNGVVENDPTCSACTGQNCTGYSCVDAEVAVKGDKGENYHWNATEFTSLTQLRKGSAIGVCYNPTKPSSHAVTNSCMTPDIRTLIMVILALSIVSCIGWWFINLRLRNNKSFQSISGVMEGADIAQSIFSNH